MTIFTDLKGVKYLHFQKKGFLKIKTNTLMIRRKEQFTYRTDKVFQEVSQLIFLHLLFIICKNNLKTQKKPRSYLAIYLQVRNQLHSFQVQILIQEDTLKRNQNTKSSLIQLHGLLIFINLVACNVHHSLIDQKFKLTQVGLFSF